MEGKYNKGVKYLIEDLRIIGKIKAKKTFDILKYHKFLQTLDK